MIEKAFDIPFVADLALREKQIQQNYRPIIAVHKWFARRPGTLFRALLLSEFAAGSLRETYFRAHDLRGIRVADPFMGGGSPLVEANRLGCDVTGYDINPMAYWIVRQEIEHLDLAAYREAASHLRARLEEQIGALYRTTCARCGSSEAHVKYFLWVKIQNCDRCGGEIDLFPGYLLARDSRHPKNVLICPVCGELNEVGDPRHPGACRACAAPLQLTGPASRGRCACPHCGKVNVYPDPAQGAPRHRMMAIEYHCPICKPGQRGRFFKRPAAEDLGRHQDAVSAWSTMQAQFVPDEEIPPGDETNRLHRWGYRRYREMFNERQLLGLEQSSRIIAGQADERIRNALATNLSDLLRYQNMLCRYDTTSVTLPPDTLDAVVTDPPYFANVQYAELMDFCYVWLRRLAVDRSGAFAPHSTRNEHELTGNETMERGLDQFTEGLSAVFTNMARALKPGAPLAFTYHHNTIAAYLPVAVAVLDAGLTCSASPPCPAEMSASIHISGTGSSIVDTVFVCRSRGLVPHALIAMTSAEVAALVRQDVEGLRAGGVRPTRGDVRCIAHGHLIRLAIWNLRKDWRKDLPMAERLRLVAAEVEQLGGWAGVAQHVEDGVSWGPLFEAQAVREARLGYDAGDRQGRYA